MQPNRPMLTLSEREASNLRFLMEFHVMQIELLTEAGLDTRPVQDVLRRLIDHERVRDHGAAGAQRGPTRSCLL